MGPKKNQKMSLGTFLQDESLGSWADEMEDAPIQSSERTGYGSDRYGGNRYGGDRGFGGDRGDRRDFGSGAGGMGNGYQDRGYSTREPREQREQLPLPTQPPYTAHLGNMAFETTSTDVSDFFKDCQVTNVRIVEDKLENKPKGFGYVEFATLEGLKKALEFSGSSLGGRGIRVSVADPPKDRQDTRDFSDWSRKGPLPELPSNNRRVSDRPPFAGRGLDNMSDAGSERGGSRRAFDQGDGRTRDFSNWERKGPLSPSSPAATSLREGGRQQSKDGPQFRHNSPAWGEGRSQEGSRPPRREYQERPVAERVPTAAEMDNQWRSKMRAPEPAAQSPTPEASTPSSPAPPPAPTTRPKLNLQKRTVSEVDPTSSNAAPADAKSSPFGAARPVDTATKEKEVEEKIQLAIRQKKEADEKSRAEKAEEKRLAKEKADAEKATQKTSKNEGKADETKETKEGKEPGEVKENGSEVPQTTPKFDILRRAESSTNDMVAEDEAEDEGEALPVADKAVKPREILQPASSEANGAWRKPKTDGAEAAEKTTTEALEEDGWSTVSKPQKQRGQRKQHQPTRALAS